MSTSIKQETLLSANPTPDAPVRFCLTCRAIYSSDFARCPSDGAPLETTSDDPLIGMTIGNYEVDSYIGGGGMGRVYRCRHSHLQHKVFALKVLRGDLSATMTMRLRFTQEAEAASQLVHPNVVSVVDFGRTETGLLYLAMEYVDGEPLSSIIRRGPLSPARSLALARQICLGLMHAHERGFVHRDLKPDNIIVVRDGEREVPRIVDFGLAIHVDPNRDSARLTTAGTIVGTPTYAAPEQMSNSDVDLRVDLFALGITLFEMLAGRPPFEADVLEMIHLNATAERPTIASRSSEMRAATEPVVPPRLESLVRRLMSAAPASRPSSTREVLDELAAIELEVELGAMSSETNEPTAKAVTAGRSAVGRRRSFTIASLGLCIVVVAGVVGWSALGPVPSRRPTLLASSTASAPISASPGPTSVAPPVHAADTAVAITVAAAEPQPAVEHSAPDTSVSRRRTEKPRAATSRSARNARTASVATGGDASAAGAGGSVETAVPVDAPAGHGADAPAVHAAAAQEREPPAAHEQPATHAPPGAPAVRDVPAPQPVDAARSVDLPKPSHVVTSARVSLDGLSVRGALTSAQIKRALGRVTPDLRACYAASAASAHKSPAVAIGVSFAIDESQRARSILSSKVTLGGLGECVARALAGLRTEAAPDVGTVDVVLTIHFTPEEP